MWLTGKERVTLTILGALALAALGVLWWQRQTQADEEQLKQAALSDERIQKFVDGQTIKHVIIVPKRLVNIVV